jgi:hypothetical protein
MLLRHICNVIRQSTESLHNYFLPTEQVSDGLVSHPTSTTIPSQKYDETYEAKSPIVYEEEFMPDHSTPKSIFRQENVNVKLRLSATGHVD